MGVITNTPFALASGMGMNAVVVLTIIYGLGFISYTLIKLFRGKFKYLHQLMIIVSALFTVVFIAEAIVKKFAGI